jgi:mono/diheme cytochrome c family protein
MRGHTLRACLIFAVFSLVLAGCGRVNLEDLTPEAVKTEQAIAAITQTASAEMAEEEAGELTGNLGRGDVLYGTWCINCHDFGQATRLRGTAYQPSEWLPFFRDGGDHPTTYDPVIQLSDENLVDILTYIYQSS